MKQIILIVLMIASLFANRLSAQTHLDVDSVQLRYGRDSLQVSMRIDLATLVISRKDIIWLTPRLVGEADSLDLPDICVYGRNPYYSYIRTGPYAHYADMQVRGKKKLGAIRYVQNVAYEPWMAQARLVLVGAQMNSCGSIVSEVREPAYTPRPAIREIQDDLKDRSARPPVIHSKSGSAHIDFILDSIVIHPEYHDNQRELDKIRLVIDSVVGNPDATPKLLTIHGYASPEGPYKHNVWLAEERTKALARYINDIYKFPDGFIQAESTPEDWDGFVRMVSQSDLPHREEILAIARSNRKPDTKMWLIKTHYPAEYKVMLRDILPYLRHSDYRIDYTLRQQVLRQIEDNVKERSATPARPPRKPAEEPLLPTTPLQQFRPYRPLLAVKTNLLFDLATVANIELEVPFGRNRLYSAMLEYWTPWYVWNDNSRAFELQVLGLELRRWFRSCRSGLPPLSGPFVGLYYANGKYDFEWDSKGDQGEFNSVGLSVGYSWVLNRHLNLEASLSAGALWGPRRHYTGEYADTHLIWRYTGHTFYAGPTKAKLSIVWLLGPTVKPPYSRLRANNRKGGAQ